MYAADIDGPQIAARFSPSMLISMQQPLPAALSGISPSFAGSLADIVSPEKKFPPARDLDGLADDVAVLSYEQALRSQGRAHPLPPAGGRKTNSAPFDASETPIQGTRKVTAPGLTESVRSSAPGAPPAPARRQSSVTIRLSAAESEQLHLRAAEADLTVSAYVRSCAFEVDSLRAEVKTALAQLRSESVSPHSGSSSSISPPTNPASAAPHRLMFRSGLPFLRRLWNRSFHRKRQS
jgi:hypothetical protein